MICRNEGIEVVITIAHEEEKRELVDIQGILHRFFRVPVIELDVPSGTFTGVVDHGSALVSGREQGCAYLPDDHEANFEHHCHSSNV